MFSWQREKQDHRVLVLAMVAHACLMAALMGCAQIKARTAASSGGEVSEQTRVASKTAKFGSVSKSDRQYRAALAATDIAGASKRQHQRGAFRGRVTAVYPSASAVGLHFAPDFTKALRGSIIKKSFANFPDLNTLQGKEVLLTGTFIGAMHPEIILTRPDQVKLVK